MSATPDEVLAAMWKAMLDHREEPEFEKLELALAAADALGWRLVPKKEAERLNEIRRMVEHCRKMEGDDQLQCFMESAVTAFNDRDMLEAEVRALRAAAPKVEP